MRCSVLTTVEAAVDRDSIRVGDPVALLIRVSAGPGEEAALPEFPEGTIGPFEILEGPDVEEGTGTDGGRVVNARYRITAFETGELEIPALASPAGGKAARPIPVAVLSVGLDPAGRPRDVKGPKAVRREPLRMILALSGILLLAGAAAFLIHRKRRGGRAPAPELGAVDLRPAHVIALERMERLREALASGETAVRPFHFALSEALRRYLSDRYALPAPERTSREILREIRREELEPEETALLRECLAACDLVKFRGVSPPDEEAARALERARVFVEKTRETTGTAGGEEAR